MLKTSVKNKLEQLKLKGFLRTAETSLNQMIEQGTSFVDMLDFCLDAEINDRSNRRIERLFSSAKFRYPTARLEHKLSNFIPHSSSVAHECLIGIICLVKQVHCWLNFLMPFVLSSALHIFFICSLVNL